MEEKEKSLWQVVKGYFNALPDKENEEETIRQISSGIVFHGANLWVLVFAVFTASLGLNVNSTAVIIGAMLISPLMGPIIGVGLAIGISDLDLLKRSIKNFFVSTLISVLTATVYFIVTPLTDAQSELLARTSPSLYDVLIALCGGAAGILALATKGKGNVIPGVAIATALMPPLCTAGYGLAVGNLSFFFGAFYLYFINTVFIALATYLGVRMLRFQRKKFVDPNRMKIVNRYILGLTLLTISPAAYLTVQIIKRSMMENSISKFVKNELDYSGTHIISGNRNDKNMTLDVVAVGNTISSSDIRKAQDRMNNYQLGAYKLNIIQGTQSDSILMLNNARNTEISNQKLMEQAAQIHALESELDNYMRYEGLGMEIRKELKAIIPSAKSIGLSRVNEARTDTTTTVRQYVIAVVECNGSLSGMEQKRLRDWLKERAKTDSLRLIISQ